MAVFEPLEFLCRDGRRLVLRHCAASDAPLFPPFQQAIARETSFTNQRVGVCPAVGEIEERWGEAQADPLVLYLGAFEADRLVGQVGFRPVMPRHPWYLRHGHFGMMVLKEYWGQGLGARLLAEMEGHARRNGIRRVEATVRTTNERGVALYRKAGYQIEGTRQQAVLIDGVFHDEFYIAKLFDELSP